MEKTRIHKKLLSSLLVRQWRRRWRAVKVRYISMTEDYKKAALEFYPVKWSCGGADASFQIDNNAGRRAVAEEVFKCVFDKLKSENVASSVSEAFLRRALRFGTDDKKINTANMSTALMAAIIAIRDGK